MLTSPIAHNETLKSQLGLQQVIHRLAILASKRIINTIIGAHDAAGARLDRIDKGPEVQLMNSFVVDVGGNG